MDKLAQLQAALRAIETGQRLESVDSVLVRQVLQQPRAHPKQAPREPDAKDLYRELLALRRAKAKAKAKQSNDDEGGDDGAAKPANRLSPKQKTAVDPRLEAAPSSPERTAFSNNDTTSAEEFAASTKGTVELMQSALVARQKELRRSEEAVAQADAELREELSRAEKVLPSQFLFERNLSSDRALDAARKVLLRFQHRFYKLYFRHWLGVTLDLRLQAQRRAVTEIVRVYRGHRGRREAQRLRRELGALQAQQRQLLAFRIKFRSSQAVKLQMAWRRFLRRRAIKHRQARQAAASLLQRAFRTRQWRSQSLVTALANARKLFAAVSFQRLYRGHRTRRRLVETRQRRRQEERVQLALLRNMSKQARAVWLIERRGAGFLIAHQAIFPYAMRLRWHRVLCQLRRQRAAKCIARAVCTWFGVEARREAARSKQVSEWLALVQREHKRSRRAAVLLQKHLRRWVQQRKFLMTQARRKKLARRTRLAEKARRMEPALPQMGRHSGLAPSTVQSSTTGRKASRFMPRQSLSPQPARLVSFLKPRQPKDDNVKAARKTEGEAAVQIQRCYRCFQSRRRDRVKKWRKEAHNVELRVVHRREAATEIQRRVRGVRGRKLARRRRAERLLLRFILRWRWRRVLRRQRAARKIGRWLKHKRTQQLAKLWSFEKHKRAASSARIQRWYRLRCLLPSRLARVARVVRKQDETLVFCAQSLELCRQHMADGCVVQSFGASLEDALRPLLASGAAASKSPAKAKASPTKQKARQPTLVAFPVLQMAFLVATGWKTPFAWHELDGKALLQTKLERAKAVAFFRSLSKRGKPVAHQMQQATVEPAAAASPTRRAVKPGAKGGKAAAEVDTFSSVDVDVAVARATGGAKGALDFTAFVRVIGHLGESSLSQQYWGRFDGAEARVLASLWLSLLPHPAMRALAAQFEAYVSSELSRHASCLQRLFMRQHNKVRGMAMLVERRRKLRDEALSRAAVLLQTQARSLLARRALRRRIQDTYEKFIDPTWGLPYWMNPRSGYSTWQKPPKLGPEDWVCYDCDEFFCLECFGEFHKVKAIPTDGEEAKEESGEDSLRVEEDVASPITREHELERLLLCGLCKFQLASRRCLDCTPKGNAKPNAKLPTPSNDDGERSEEALFCDVCFGFLHRRGGLQAHRTEPLLELCASCISEDEASVPSAGDAVQWECGACGGPPPRRVCGRCAAQFHPSESCGELGAVPLQTLGRRQRTKRLQDEQEARDRRDLDKMRARALRARQERCARKIQAFWRAQAPMLRARRLLAARRKEKGELWLRRQEDARLAKRLAYRSKNALGIAPSLTTDSPVERRLRSLHAIARRQLFIRARFFGLLVDEYVTVGVPLPGLGLLRPGSNEVWTSEDLRGWIRNRQTLRFKRLAPQQAQPAERALCAWRQLERWGKTEVHLSEPGDQGDQVSQPEASDAPWLADVHAKQAITETTVPLAQPYDPPAPKKTHRKAEEEEVEDVPVAMFLVEFSLDPKRTVWINHSLAERLWEWKRLKLLARSERTGQRQRAKEYEKQQKELEDKRKQEEELNRKQSDVAGGDTQAAAVEATVAAVEEQAWLPPNPSWTTTETAPYNYYPSANPTETTAAWTGNDAYSASYPAGYDYGYGSPAPASYPEAAGLVDSSSYYANEANGSGGSNWYGTEYSAYEMSGYSPAPTDSNYYANGSNSSGWDAYTGYGSAAGSGTDVDAQAAVDPNAAWYANGGDSGYAYGSDGQWQQSDYTQAQAGASYPSAGGSSAYDVSASSYSINLPSAAAGTDGYYYPYTSSGDDQTYSTSQPASAGEWEEVFDPATQQTYYVNRLTNETAWEPPTAQ